MENCTAGLWPAALEIIGYLEELVHYSHGMNEAISHPIM
jgi:hypothetical protein